MPEMVFAFVLWIVVLVGIGINVACKDQLGRILALIAFFLAVITSIGVFLVIKGVIK
ncbi:hypothetical protein [Enterococcus sp. AZ109]|uniref:hypothetical protein n=1 Tax=Enterococcus sp. AZ109 TaxID=2774634 RepID=UPI003F25166B